MLLLWIIVGMAVSSAVTWRVSERRTANEWQEKLERHECSFDTVEIEHLPSEWTGMVESLGWTPEVAQQQAASQEWRGKIAELTQPRVLVKATCACANTKVVLVYGKQATPFMEGKSGGLQKMLNV